MYQQCFHQSTMAIQQHAFNGPLYYNIENDNNQADSQTKQTQQRPLTTDISLLEVAGKMFKKIANKIQSKKRFGREQ